MIIEGYKILGPKGNKETLREIKIKYKKVTSENF
jgi:hypothetical protein